MGSTYDQDLVRWSEEQGRALRAAGDAGLDASIDWQNVAVEIEGLGLSDRQALAAAIASVIEHLLKLQASPSPIFGRGMKESIFRARYEIEVLLAESPSLRSEIAGIIAREFADARTLVRDGLKDHGEQPLIDLDQVTYSEDQVLGEWMPGSP